MNNTNSIFFSNRGACDSDTGSCLCDDGFEGRACERKTCPLHCSGHGRCKSMRCQYTTLPCLFLLNQICYRGFERMWGDILEVLYLILCIPPPLGLFVWLRIFNRYHASTRDPGDEGSAVYSAIWDADMMHGCECDEGYEGPDCSLRVSLLPSLLTVSSRC